MFDGAPLPSKQSEVEGHHQRRAKARAEAANFRAGHLQDLDDMSSADIQIYKKYCDRAAARESWMEDDVKVRLTANRTTFTDMLVTHEIAMFEADPQLAHLVHLGLYHFVISDDQDIALYDFCNVLYHLGGTVHDIC